MLERDDIQGLVLSGYASTPRSRYFFVRFAGSGAREWLSRLLPRLTTATRGERKDTRRLNLALSATGLAALGLPEEALATFPREFVQGMADDERSQVLGDCGVNAPAHWDFGHDPATRVDALLLLYAATEAELDDWSADIEEELERFGLVAHEEDTYLPENGREHFGFKDGITNVRLETWPRLRHRNRFEPRVPAGEFLLGHRNAYSRFPDSPRVPVRRGTRSFPRIVDGGRAMDLGENGTYVAVRKLAQDVGGFWRFASARGAELFPDEPEGGAERFASLLVGRTLDGAPLALPPSEAGAAPQLNRFGYREGGELGTRCPVGAHIRRANPRDGLGDDPAESLGHVRAHRVIRRGRLYGPSVEPGTAADPRPRGLMFMAFCANLRRQFEFIHESWLNGPKFGGLTHERDPLVGSGAPLSSAAGEETFSLQEGSVRRRCSLERFVTVRGGAYLFMPGRRALAYLAEP